MLTSSSYQLDRVDRPEWTSDMTHIPTGPGQSFSIPLAPPSPSIASPLSTSATVLDSPQSYQPSHYRRASEGPAGGYGTPKSTQWEYDRDDKQIALLQSVNRNIMVVFWYQVGMPSIFSTGVPVYEKFSGLKELAVWVPHSKPKFIASASERGVHSKPYY